MCTLSSVWLWDPVDCSLPGSSDHVIFQARILKWVAISSSRGSSHPEMELLSPAPPALAGRSFTTVPPGKLNLLFHEQLLNCYIYEKCIHDVSYVYVCSSIANMQKICKNSMNFQIIHLIHICCTSRNWHQISLLPILVICTLSVASSIRGQKNPHKHLSPSVLL